MKKTSRSTRPVVNLVIDSRVILRDILKELGRKGGRVKSAAKAAAARENGRQPKRKRAAKLAVMLLALGWLAVPAQAQSLRQATETFAIAATADWLSTRAMLKRGGMEHNPMLSWLEHKPDAMVAIGAASDVLGVWALHKTVGKKRPKLAAVLLYAASAGRVYLTIRNMRVARTAHQPWGPSIVGDNMPSKSYRVAASFGR